MDVTSPPPESYRRLSLLDLIGLVTASGLGLAARSFALAEVYPEEPSWPADARDWLFLISIQALMLAWLVVLRGLGRLPIERRQPGFLTAAGIVVGSGFATMWQHGWLEREIIGFPLWERILIPYVFSPDLLSVGFFAATVAAVWLTLLVPGTWRPVGGSMNRLGLACGGGFLVLFVVDWLDSEILILGR